MKLKQKKICLLLLAVSVFMVGCSASKGSKTSGVEVDTSPIAPAEDDNEGNENLVIGSITMSNDGEWFGEVMAGVRRAASDLGVTLVEQNSDGDEEAEAGMIHKFIEDKVDAIVICPITSDHTGESLAQAEAAGIPSVTWNTIVDADITAEVCVDSNALGGDTGDYLSEYIRTNNLSGLKMGLITNESYTIGVARCEGFKEAIKSLEKDGSVEVVDEKLAELTDESTDAVSKMLEEHPDLDIIWCWNQTSLLACIDVVKEQGNKDLLVLGTDMSMDLAKDMQGNDVNLMAVTTQLPYNMGYKAVVNAVQAAKGKEVDKTIIIPTFTYIKSDTDGLAQYIECHKEFAQ